MREGSLRKVVHRWGFTGNDLGTVPCPHRCIIITRTKKCMTKEDKLAAIRRKIIEANPEIVAQTYRGSAETGYSIAITGRPIRLADVLVAMAGYSVGIECDGMAIDRHGRFFNWLKNEEHQPDWNLHADDLEQQSDETISFLYSLLV